MSPPVRDATRSVVERIAPSPRRGHGGIRHEIIEAKLLIPQSRRGAVRRTKLLRELQGTRGHHLVSLVAPPGYGKTSALAQWAGSGQRSVTWLTADEGDNDPVVFLSYLAAAIDRVEPVDPAVFRAIESPAVSGRAVVGRLVSAVSAQATPVLLVIDDAHTLHDRACLDLLAEFIDHLPEGSGVALASRTAIALPFARWRAEASVVDVGPGQLALDDDEAVQLGHRLGSTLSADELRDLTHQTEGWPALLALAVLAANRATDRPGHAVSGADLPIADYLRSELLEPRTEAEITFLTRTSILERLSGPLCDVVADQPGSAAMLTELARSTLLIDEYGGSFRYHSLLREFLRDELALREPDAVARLHRRASEWYEASGAIDAAAEHAFASGDVDRAAATVGKAMLLYHWSGRRATTRMWFRRFDEDAIQPHPWLTVLAAWEELGAGDVDSTEHLADIAERGSFHGRPPDGTGSFESGRAMLRAAMCRRGADDALTNAARAVELEPIGNPWRDFALWMLSIARSMAGDPDGADGALADGVVAARSSHNLGLCHCLLGHRALLAIDRHDWDAAIVLSDAARTIQEGHSLDGYLSSAPARIAEIRISIHRGDVAGARQALTRAVRLRPLLTAAAPSIGVMSLLGFARAHLALGDAAGARTLLTQANGIIRVCPDLGVLPAEVAALRATAASLPIGLAGASTLTTAELRVLAMLPFYLSFKEIGQRLGVKATTIKTHALAIYGKLGASTRSEAIELAVEAGLLERFPS